MPQQTAGARIDLPFPRQHILFHDQTEAADGDRTRQREGWPAGANPPEPGNISRALAQANGQREPQRPKAACPSAHHSPRTTISTNPPNRKAALRHTA